MILRAFLLIALLPLAAQAQSTRIGLGGESHDATQPVEITAERLDLDQGAGRAVFRGDVRVAQGDLRMAADEIDVTYSTEGGGGTVEKMTARGAVTLSNGSEAAEAQEAVYVVSTGIVEMSGNVILTQGPNALSGQSLRIDLTDGTGTIEGRVQTIFQPGSTE